jgi:glutaredoxin
MSSPPPRLALYSSRWCPYCMRVWSAVRALGVEVEDRDLGQDARWERELYAARGRHTVPVLRITDDQGRDEWMPESADIIAWLRRHYER